MGLDFFAVVAGMIRMGYSVICYPVICYTVGMSLFSKEKESDVVALFDVGSGSVGGAIVHTARAHPPTVLYSFRSDIPFQEEAAGSRLLSLMLRTLSQVTQTLLHEGFDAAGFGTHRPRVREIFISLSAPWVLSRTSTLRLRNEEPIPITRDVFSSLLEHGEQDEDGSTKHALPKGSVRIEQKLIRSVLNGYETASPYGKKAREAEFSIFGSFSVPHVTERISDGVTELMHPKHVSFHSFALVAFAALRELYPDEADFILVDVSGEQTELAVVKNHVLVETATFPFGKNKLFRVVGKEGTMPPSGAASLFKLYAENKGAGRLFERSKKLFQIAEAKWREQFSKALSSVSEGLFLPGTIFLTADDDVMPLFESAIATGDFGTFTLSSAPFRTIEITSERLGTLVTWGASVVPDPFIGLISAFINHLSRE